MIIRNEIYQLIRTDTVLRRKIADAIGVTDSTVYGHAVRKAPKLQEYQVIKIIREYTGKSEDEIFETEKKK